MFCVELIRRVYSCLHSLTNRQSRTCVPTGILHTFFSSRKLLTHKSPKPSALGIKCVSVGLPINLNPRTVLFVPDEGCATPDWQQLQLYIRSVSPPLERTLCTLTAQRSALRREGVKYGRNFHLKCTKDKWCSVEGTGCSDVHGCTLRSSTRILLWCLTSNIISCVRLFPILLSRLRAH